MPNAVKWFRKHRKESLVILTLMTMLSFIFVPILLDVLSASRRGGGNPVVVTTTKYGQLRQHDIDNLVHERQRVAAVVYQLAELGLESERGRGFAEQVLANMGLNDTSEQSVVQTWLLAQRASQLGLQVTDDTVRDFIKRALTRGKVSNDRLNEIVKRQGTSVGLIIEGLKRVLLAGNLVQMFGTSVSAMSPAENFDYFLRLNRQAKIEAVAVPVQGFIAKVADPSQHEVQEFFEKYKDKIQNPQSPEPGLREPHRIAIQYLQASREKYLDKKAVTDDEIKQFYEKNKEQYRDFSISEPATKTEPSLKSEPALKSEPPKSEQPKPSPAKPEAPKAEPEKPQPDEGKKAEENKKASSAGRKSLIRLAAFEEKKEDAKVIAPGEEEEALAKTDAPPAKTEPTAKNAKPAAKTDAVAKKQEAGKPAEKPAPPPRYRPLDEVREEIRTRIAEEKALQKMQDVLNEVRSQLSQFQTQWLDYEAQVAEKKETTKPVPPDFNALAKKHGLTAVDTGLVSAWEIQKYPIAHSMINGIPFAQYAYGSLPVYQAVIARQEELSGDQFLFWKVNETEERTPELTDDGVRDRAVAEWKTIKARDLAQQEAERLAEEARRSSKPLKEATGRDPISPPPFSWMTYGDKPMDWMRGRMPEISTVKGIDDPGMTFMRSVFRLQPGQYGIAWNQPNAVVYTVRLVNYLPPQDELVKQFLQKPEFLSGEYLGAAQVDRREMFTAWRNQIEADSGLRWLREPTQERRRTRR